MAASKSNFHVRSISLPSKSHPLLQQCNEHLARLDASDAASSSSLNRKLSGLEDLHECVEKLLQLPSTQQAFVQGRHEQWVDQLVDGSLRLLDLCSAAKDAVLHTKEFIREIQSIMRRRRGAEFSLESEIRKYSVSRKVVKKVIRKALSSLKGVQTKSSCSPSNKDSETAALISALREVEVVTHAVFESLLSFISGPKEQTKLGGWSLVPKLMHSKRVGSEEEAQHVNEFTKVDAAMHRLMSHEMKIEKVQSELQNLEMCVQDFEERLECLFRRLIKTRLSILNILNY
ncbi:hypothetical protein TIFTF001_052196 [Ficus carica]|uniref:DUF241 domain protein n=1 Tax=Ficus carica TaxID=3494 RepID=A0AA88EG73_FICCA|nr:hypothetical protein TIFTF001_052184 [Ficus carica]GMN73501.1 hypothetical protein TIFTF001_052186 [Ficus carica]GMN73535.1 hypothetical protein TIFTF001_052194 [Ficus carica]GMN73541.1 hypothetical protein TIFTF001_052196 [Ficus carica]